MSRANRIGRLRELTVKGTHLVLRQIGLAPELLQARRLRRSLDDLGTGSNSLSGRRILIPTMRDWASHVHLEALLGHYLRSEGAIVRHLSCGGGLTICDRANTWEAPPMPCRGCSSYVSKSLHAHGAPVSWLRDGLPDENWDELDLMGLDQLLAAEWRSYPLGRMVEIPVKWFLLAENLHADPLATQTYREFLRSARRVLESVELEFDRDPPDQVVLLNGLFMFEAVIWEVARRNGIPVVSYERAFIIDSIVFAHNQVASYYRIDDVWESAKTRELSSTQSAALDEYLGERRSGLRTIDNYWKSVSSARLDSTNMGRRAVLFTNLVWDSAVLGQDVAFPSIVDWLEEAVETFRSLPRHELVIRVHPAETKLSGRESRERMEDSLMRRVGTLPRNIRIVPSEDNTSSYELMEGADFGLVYSSTAGMEMVLAGKPVIVAAQTHYRDKGFTIDVSSPGEFRSAVEDLVSAEGISVPDIDLARRYASLFFFDTPYFKVGVSEPMRGLVRFDSTSFSDLLDAGRGDVRRLIRALSDGRSFNLPLDDPPSS